MLKSVTSYLNIDLDAFDETGAFNSVLGIDARLFVDPFLLSSSKAEELRPGRQKILDHFQRILTLLNATNSKNDKTWSVAEKLLSFPEPKGFSFGYGGQGSSGSGMGPKFRKQLMASSYEIVKKGVVDPVIFELVGIFEEGIGCDRISDMVCRILYSDFLKYSERIFTECGVVGQSHTFNHVIYKLPTYFGHPIVLAPKDILRDLPMATDWGDIEFVCAANRELRDKISEIIGIDWRKEVKKWHKRDLKKFLLNNPQVLQDLITSYNSSKPKYYNHDSDPTGESTWFSIAKHFTQRNPLTLDTNHTENDLKVLLEIVKKILEKFRQLIEFNGLNNFLYKEDGSPKPEQASQLIFYAISGIYCEANNLSVSREANAGRGPVDFKIADGCINVVVDLKLSTNSSLIHAYEKQIPIYEKAEGSSAAFIVVLKVKDESTCLARLLKRKAEDKSRGIVTPEIVSFDATIKPSASKA